MSINGDRVNHFVIQSSHMTSELAIIANSVLLLVIMRRSGKELGNYKYLLFAYTLMELLSSIITVSTVPLFATNSVGLVFHSTTAYFTQTTSTAFLYAYTVVYALLAYILTCSFVYRYFVFCMPRKLIWFNDRKRVLMLIIVALAITTFLNTFLFIFHHPRAEYEEMFHFETVDLNRDGYFALAKLGSNGDFDKRTLCSYAMWCTIMGGCTFIIVYIIIAMQKKMTNVAATSPALRKMQKTMFTLLILQTLVPLVSNYIPVISSYLMPFVDFDTSLLNLINSAFMPLSPLIDPILIFLFVRDYREYIVDVGRKLLCLKNRTNRVSTMASITDRLTYA